MSSKETGRAPWPARSSRPHLENRGAGGKRRTEALGALGSCTLFQFCGASRTACGSWISPYFLEARGYSTVGAVNMYTMAWVAYNVGQIIMSPIAGDIADAARRRPALLASVVGHDFLPDVRVSGLLVVGHGQLLPGRRGRVGARLTLSP